MRARPLLVALAAGALGIAGCGIGPGAENGPVSIVVTRDFGRLPVEGSPASLDVRAGETAMRALQRTFKVGTRYGGGFVQTIEGLSGGQGAGGPSDWFFYVNGIEATKGAADTDLHRGDVVWWDHHDWRATMSVPAVVGSFPEPFVHGEDGKRLPTRVECATSAQAACALVQKHLGAAGVVAGVAALGVHGGEDELRVLVGPWPALRPDFAARLLEQGPRASGVYARPARNGRTIAVLDPSGHVARTLGAGTGLIAATNTEHEPPTWIISGTDAAGVLLAARNLTSDALNDRFAVALSGDLPISLPQVGGAS